MAIPKVIHYCWFGGAELPNEVKKCIESWKKYCPDYEIIRWDETNYNYKKYQFSYEAYQNKKWAFVSDIARLEIIYNYGGIYLDTDVELLKSLDGFLDEPAFMGFEHGRNVATGLGFGAEKGNMIIKENIDLYQEMSFVKEDGKLNLIPCPQVTTKVLEKYGLERIDKVQKLEGVSVFSSEYFCPMLFSDGTAEITSNTVSIHHYAGTWTTAKEKREVRVRRIIYTYFGVKVLSVYDGIILLKTQGIKAFVKRFIEKFVSKNNI